MNAHIIDADVLAEMISDEIDPVAQLGQRFEPMQNTKRCAARLKKRLRRNHQNFHYLVACCMSLVVRYSLLVALLLMRNMLRLLVIRKQQQATRNKSTSNKQPECQHVYFLPICYKTSFFMLLDYAKSNENYNLRQITLCQPETMYWCDTWKIGLDYLVRIMKKKINIDDGIETNRTGKRE